MTRRPDREHFQRQLGYQFRDADNLTEVLTHVSLLNEPAGQGRRSNLRLAYLGDAVIELAVRHELANQMAGKSREDWKQRLVENEALGKLAQALQLDPPEVGGSVRHPEFEMKIMAEVFEAAIGAVYLEAGYAAASQLVLKHVRPTP